MENLKKYEVILVILVLVFIITDWILLLCVNYVIHGFHKKETDSCVTEEKGDCVCQSQSFNF